MDFLTDLDRLGWVGGMEAMFVSDMPQSVTIGYG